MKKRLLVISIALVSILAFGLIGCGNKVELDSATATAYGMLHKQYAGKVTVTVDKDKKITDVFFEEFLPIHDIANQGDLINEEHRDGSRAKWVKIGNEIFTYTRIQEESGDLSEIYGYRNATWANGTTYELQIGNNPPQGKTNAFENAEFTKWYIEQVSKGNYFICKNATGTEVYSDTEIPFTAYTSNGLTTKVTKKTYCDKNINGYWTIGSFEKTEAGVVVAGTIGTQTQLGWRGNMAAMKSAILEFGLDAYTGQETKDGTFKLGSNVTSATLSDYHQYMGLAVKAYDAAKTILG